MPYEESLPSSLACRDLVDELASTDESMLSLPSRVHLSECLRCQDELASYRRLSRMMRSLAAAPVDSDPTLEHEISVRLDQIDNGLDQDVQQDAAKEA